MQYLKHTSRKLTNGLCNGNSHGMGRPGILPRNNLSINNHLLPPILLGLDILSTHSLNFILQQLGHLLTQLDRILLGIAKPRRLLALEQRLPIDRHVGEDNGSVAHRRDRLAGAVELLDELDGRLVLDEVEHGAVAARVEDGGVLGGLAKEFLEGPRLGPEVLLGVEEFDGFFVLFEHGDGVLVQGGFTAGWGGDDDVDLGVGLVCAYEVVVRMGEFRLVGSVGGHGRLRWEWESTKYQPVGRPSFIWPQLVRTTRTLGAIVLSLIV